MATDSGSESFQTQIVGDLAVFRSRPAEARDPKSACPRRRKGRSSNRSHFKAESAASAALGRGLRFHFLFSHGTFFFSPAFALSRLIHGGQFLNGLAGPTIMSAGPFLSTTWFAPDQRATATALATLFSYLGGAASFLVGPLAVPAPNNTAAGSKAAGPEAPTMSDSSIRDSIQLVMYAGTSRNRQGRAGGIDSTSF